MYQNQQIHLYFFKEICFITHIHTHTYIDNLKKNSRGVVVSKIAD